MLSFFSLAQNNEKADSLIQELETSQLTNEEKLVMLNRISNFITDPDLKIFYGQQAKDLAVEINDKIGEQSAYINLGYAHKLRGELSKALEAYLSAAEIGASLKDNIIEADAYVNVAGIYAANQNYDRSLMYLEKAEKLYKDTDDVNRLAGFYINYGYNAYLAKNYELSVALSNEAVKYSTEVGSDYLIAYAKANLALAQSKLGQFDEAEENIQTSITLLKKNKDYYGLSDCLIELGQVYVEQKQTDKGLELLEEGYQIAKTHGLKQQIQNGANYLFQVYKNRKDYLKAIQYQEKYYAYRDSLINAEQIRELADLRTEYEVGQKQAELDLLSAEKKAQQILLWSISGGAFLIIVLLGLVYRNNREKSRINQLLEEQKAELERLNQTKDKFFSIISHDLRGPVHAFSGISRIISYAAEVGDKEELNEIAQHIDETANHLSGLLDNLLNWATQQQGHFPYVPEKLDVSELAAETKGIFGNMAQSKHIKLSIDVEENLYLWSDKNMTMTILRNLTNNALKFTHEGGEVLICASAKDDHAELIVQDNGIGIPKDKLDSLFKMEGKKSAFGTAGEKGLGLGLQLVYEFVKINNGQVSVESKEGQGTTFKIILPLFSSKELVAR